MNSALRVRLAKKRAQWIVVVLFCLLCSCSAESELLWPEHTLPEPVGVVIPTHVRNDINCKILLDGVSSILETWLTKSNGGIAARLRPFHMYVLDNGSPRGDLISHKRKKMYNEQLGMNASYHYDSQPCFRNVSQRFPRVLTVNRNRNNSASAYEVGAMLLAWRLPRVEYLYYASNSTPVSDTAHTGNIPALQVSSLRLSLQDMAKRGSGQVVQLQHSLKMRQFIPPSHMVMCKFSPMVPISPFFYDIDREQRIYAVKALRAMGVPPAFQGTLRAQIGPLVSGLVAHSAFFASFNKSLPVSNNNTLSMLSYIELLLKLEQKRAMPSKHTQGMAWERLNACIFSWYGMDVKNCSVHGVVQKIHGGNRDHV